ncbi:MAG: DUF1549 domain-containing protein [Planctomycetota bacterium]|nr:MAG: DUF1549 domain-containing protein [Planctomycetota bacterium]REJ88067.1 MAG: DUF1549 domain-containing protein [Planctomycetota bacterium]REK28826.1 MAG: DUF1549 domain-containing protein [Planctomycetota bacterium]
MHQRTLLLPILVALLIATVAGLAARSPLQDEPQGLKIPVAGDLAPVVQEVNRAQSVLWSDAGVAPAGRADDLTVLRRLSLALHGTIPSLEEIRRFEADDRPDRLEHWTIAMLEDPRFADYFAQRLSRPFVGVDEGQFVIFRRDRFNEWLSGQLENHRPYDEIVTEMITGTGVWTGDAEVNFLTGAFANDEFDEDKLAGRTVRAFLGQRIDCAQCHDHPFTHWKQSEFEGLASHFGQVRVSLVGIEDDAQVLFTLPAETAEELSAGQLSQQTRKNFKNDDRLRANPTVETLTEGESWLISDAPNDDGEIEPRFICRRKADGIEVARAAGEHLIDDQVTGEKRIAPPRVPFGEEWVPETGTRREKLAAWVTHPENRRFERAIANRVWALMFGKPYYPFAPVDDLPDPDDEQADVHTAVLDVLGADFRAHGCDLRRLVQVIAASDAFRMESIHPVQLKLEESGELAEEEYRDLSRTVELIEERWAVFPLVRLRPEQVIGSMLQANHVTTIDRNSHLFVRAQRFFQEQNFINVFGDPGEEELEDRTGTIPQALLRMNGEFSQSLTDPNPFRAVGRISGMAPTPEKKLEVSYLVCLTRRPTPEEINYFLPQFENSDQPDGVMQDLFWTLFNSPEFSWNH